MDQKLLENLQTQLGSSETCDPLISEVVDRPAMLLQLCELDIAESQAESPGRKAEYLQRIDDLEVRLGMS